MQRNAVKCREMKRNDAEKYREIQWNAVKCREMQKNSEITEKCRYAEIFL